MVRLDLRPSELLYVPPFVRMFAEMVPVLLMLLIVQQFNHAVVGVFCATIWHVQVLHQHVHSTPALQAAQLCVLMAHAGDLLENVELWQPHALLQWFNVLMDFV
jgi:hypothetical protein